MNKFLSFPQLKPEKGIPYCREHLRRLIEAGRFPMPVILSAKPGGRPTRIAWVESEVDEWVAQRIAARDARAA